MYHNNKHKKEEQFYLATIATHKLVKTNKLFNAYGHGKWAYQQLKMQWM
jgi:hypothetical protein